MSDTMNIDKVLDDILTSKFATKPNGRAWCMRHSHKLDMGVCVSCDAVQAIKQLIKEVANQIVGEYWGVHCELKNCDQCRNREQRNYQMYEQKQRLNELLEGEK